MKSSAGNPANVRCFYSELKANKAGYFFLARAPVIAFSNAGSRVRVAAGSFSRMANKVRKPLRLSI